MLQATQSFWVIRVFHTGSPWLSQLFSCAPSPLLHSSLFRWPSFRWPSFRFPEVLGVPLSPAPCTPKLLGGHCPSAALPVLKIWYLASCPVSPLPHVIMWTLSLCVCVCGHFFGSFFHSNFWIGPFPVLRNEESLNGSNLLIHFRFSECVCCFLPFWLLRISLFSTLCAQPLALSVTFFLSVTW